MLFNLHGELQFLYPPKGYRSSRESVSNFDIVYHSESRNISSPPPRSNNSLTPFFIMFRCDLN